MSLGRKEAKEKTGAHAEFCAHPILFLSVSNRGKEDWASYQCSVCPGCTEGGEARGAEFPDGKIRWGDPTERVRWGSAAAPTQSLTRLNQ